MKRLLVLSKYGLRAASTRYRFAQYFPALRAAGFEPELSPLLDDGYLEAQLLGHADPFAGLRGARRRLHDLLRAGRYSAALLNYEAFPFLPAVYERLLACRLPFLLDLDDAIFHRYDRSPLWAPLLSGKIRSVARHARIVIAGNSYLAAHFEGLPTPVRRIPTVVDSSLYLPRSGPPRDRPVIGWIGSPSTAPFLAPVMPVLRELRARLVFVGTGRAGSFPGAELREWSEENEVREVQDFDIGIMPLPDDPWSRGKCGFKLIQYMACGKPVVASPVGVNREIVSAGCGFLAGSAEEWKSALSRLLESPELRARLGGGGRARVEAEYSLQRWSGDFVSSVAQLCDGAE